MIFVVLGTWEMPFVRPLIEIERAVADGVIHEPVCVQCGNTVYASSRLEMTPFFAPDELDSMYEKADMVICQAGVGSIMLGLKKRKKVIAIARLARFDEHIDDHQCEILDVFSKSGAILSWAGTGDLTAVLARAATFVSAGYPFGEEKISRAILDFLDKSIRGP